MGNENTFLITGSSSGLYSMSVPVYGVYSMSVPVCTGFGVAWAQNGTAIPINTDSPSTAMFRGEDMLVTWESKLPQHWGVYMMV